MTDQVTEALLLEDALLDTVSYLKEQGVKQPKIGLVLGSGLGSFADQLTDPIRIAYEDIPHFPISTVQGHAGQFVYGTYHGVPVLAMQGRFHFYEGYSMQRVTYPVRVMHALGIQTLLLTNAAGGANAQFHPGQLMLIQDHINFMGTNPLIGPNEAQLGPRFPDMSEAYSMRLRNIAQAAAKTLGIELVEGVYMAFSGPTYETPAEVRFAQIVGADAVGMSTVPEVIVARHMGMEVLGISCITNMAAGLQDVLSHEEVVETTTRVRAQFEALVGLLIQQIG